MPYASNGTTQFGGIVMLVLALVANVVAIKMIISKSYKGGGEDEPGASKGEVGKRKLEGEDIERKRLTVENIDRFGYLDPPVGEFVYTGSNVENSHFSHR